MLTKWETPNSDTSKIDLLQESTGYSRFVCEVLVNRGISTTEKLAALNASEGAQALQDPLSFHDIAAVARRIQGAVWLGEKICVFGDYDCDGVTSTTILVSCIQDMGGDVTFYIPNRFSEGYGMNNSAIDKLSDEGVDLIVTVDNGISAANEIDYALSLGMDVVVTDHHSIPDGPLPFVPTVNPHLPECPSVFKDIAGVGVAFYLSCALTKQPPEIMLEKYADIVALGSVADVMPLVGDNRIFVMKGIEMLQSGKVRPGIKSLLEVAGVAEKSISARTFGFALGPRINAAGRMDDATNAVQMMLSHNHETALVEAKRLDELNITRKSTEENIMKEIDEIFLMFPNLLMKRVIVVSGADWHQGVIGIVAARLVERYGKPSIVFTSINGIAHGSGRSIPEVSLIDAINGCREHLIRFGGHSQAAGMSIEVDKMEAFATSMDLYCFNKYPIMPVPSVQIDAKVEIEDLSIANVKALSVLEPFGEQNPSPQFVVSGATIVDFDSLSQGKHIKVHFKKGQKTFSALYFQMSPQTFPYRENDVVDVLIQLEVGVYRNEEQLSVFVRNIIPANFDASKILEDFELYNRFCMSFHDNKIDYELLRPSRENIAAAFRFIRERGMTPTPPELIFMQLSDFSFQKTLITLDVMVEMGFVQVQGGNYLPADISTKRNLDDSKILKSLSQ